MKSSLIRDFFPTYFPTVFPTDALRNWAEEAEQLFKQPIKQAFPYPIEVKRVYSSATGKLKKLTFEVALAGLSENDIHVQLKQNKWFTIKIEHKDEDTPAEVENSNETEKDTAVVKSDVCDEIDDVVYSTKSIARRDAEITFKLLSEIDIDKFKNGVQFKNGLLTVELYPKEQTIEDADVIDAPILS